MNASATKLAPKAGSQPLRLQKDKKTFSLKKKFTATPEQKVGLWVNESKRNKWREARREAPFMPDCDLEPKPHLLLPTRNTARISRAKPLPS